VGCQAKINCNKLEDCWVTSKPTNFAKSLVITKASECSDVKNYKRRLNPVWYRQQWVSKGFTSACSVTLPDTAAETWIWRWREGEGWRTWRRCPSSATWRRAGSEVPAWIVPALVSAAAWTYAVPTDHWCRPGPTPPDYNIHHHHAMRDEQCTWFMNDGRKRYVSLCYTELVSPVIQLFFLIS